MNEDPEIIDTQKRGKFAWQWEFHMQQVWIHAIWATILILFAALSLGEVDGIDAKVAAGLFAFASFCSLLSSRYHEFMASHKKWVSMDQNVPVRQKDLNRSYWWAKNLAIARELSSFLGLVSFIAALFLN
jgi:hypothetical protein